MEQAVENSEHITAVRLNLRAVMLHISEHDSDINGLTGNPVSYTIGSDRDLLVANFGVLAIQNDPDERTVSATALGKTVMRDVMGELEVFEPGAWMETLLAIRHQLEERFGLILDEIPEDPVR
jgi:hypothetical protein